MTPEELEREREASRKRRQKALDERRAEFPATERFSTAGLTRAQKAKLRDDDYVPPQD